MLYVITTKRPGRYDYDPPPIRVESRRAVATLEEARRMAWRTAEFGTWSSDAVTETLPESGGTVGPLPDGTVIEVEPASWDDLVGPGGWNASTSEAEVVDAYNAREARSR